MTEPPIIIPHGLVRAGRRVLRSILLCIVIGAVGVAVPDPAGAHSYGHTCGPRVASSGFSCRLGTTSTDAHVQRYIRMYYDGRERGYAMLRFDHSSNIARLVRVCDADGGDTTVPALRIDTVDSTAPVYEYQAPRGACTTRQTHFQVWRHRAVTRNSSTNSVNHGTIWYQRDGWQISG